MFGNFYFMIFSLKNCCNVIKFLLSIFEIYKRLFFVGGKCCYGDCVLRFVGLVFSFVWLCVCIK